MDQIHNILRHVRISDSVESDFKRLEMNRWNISFSGDGTDEQMNLPEICIYF